MHYQEHYRLLQNIAEKLISLTTQVNQFPTHVPEILNKYMEVTKDIQGLITVFLHNPDKLMKMQMEYWTDAFKLMQDQYSNMLTGKHLPIEDKRFEGPAWLHNPWFNQISQHYLLATRHIQTLLENMEFKDKTIARRMQFVVRQYMDALSPSNFIATNPKLMAETLQTQGKNVLKGFNNLLNDIQAGSGNLNITMTDKSAFAVGKNLAITKGKVIFRNSMIELIQYTPQKPKVYSVPLLVIPPWINKFYILDLSKKNSLVNWLVGQGITVFMISWVNPDSSYADKTLYDYMNEGPATAVDIIKKQLNVSKVNTMGFCIGGTLLAMLLAYQKYHQDNSIKSAIFLATLLDFKDPGDISVFIDEQQIAKLEKSMKAKGYLAGKFMASSFNALRANDLFWTFFIKNYLQGKEAAPFDILYWNGDTTNMPAAMHTEYLRGMYLHNNLIEPGKIKLNKTPIDIHQIDIPVLFVGTQKDHIAPWKSTWAGYHVMKGKKQFILGGSGHIAGIINPPGSGKYGYCTNDMECQTPDEWLAGGVWHEDSWWPEGLKWLIKQSGKKIEAPDFKNLPFPGIMDAPGEYVISKSSL